MHHILMRREGSLLLRIWWVERALYSSEYDAWRGLSTHHRECWNSCAILIEVTPFQLTWVTPFNCTPLPGAMRVPCTWTAWAERVQCNQIAQAVQVQLTGGTLSIDSSYPPQKGGLPPSKWGLPPSKWGLWVLIYQTQGHPQDFFRRGPDFSSPGDI